MNLERRVTDRLVEPLEELEVALRPIVRQAEAFEALVDAVEDFERGLLTLPELYERAHTLREAAAS